MAQGRLRARFVGGLLGAILALGAVGAGIALAADHAVAIAGSSFSPATVTVVVGDTVTWTNSDQISHTATADGGAFDTGALGNGESETVTFSTAGSFAYHCAIHPDMTGTITVEAAPVEPTPVPTNPPNAAPTDAPNAAPTNPPTDAASVASTDTSPGIAGASLLIGGAGLLGLFFARRRLARG